MDKKSFIFLLILSIPLTFSMCSDNSENKIEEKSKNAISNPNGMSEMALLMETMSNDMFLIKDSLLLNKNIPNSIQSNNYKSLFYAKTTKQNVIDSAFINFASAFIYSMDIMVKSKIEDRVKEYNRLVISCQNCHQAICPGPLARINELPIKVN